MSLQGGWEDDESVEAAARRETVEEAGVRGTIEVCVTNSSLQLLRGQRQQQHHMQLAWDQLNSLDDANDRHNVQNYIV